MGKIKSALLLVLYTLLIAFLCFICTVSFNYGENDLHTFSSILDLTAKDADLGGTYGANDTYSGGGYSAVYYPEGVISVSEYEDDLAGISDEKDRTDYQNKYRASENGALYLEVGTACDENGAVLASFTEAFASAVETMTARYEALHADGARVSVRDDYTIEVFLPEMLDGEYYTISRFAYTGELSLTYGTSEDAATDVLKVKRNESVSDYVTGVSSRSSGGTHYIELHFTQKGADALAKATANAGSSSDSSSSSTTNYLYIYVGDTAIISLQVSEALTGNALYISGSYTAETAAATAILLDSAVDGTADDLTFTAGSVRRERARLAVYLLRRALRGDDAVLLHPLRAARVRAPVYLSAVHCMHHPLRLGDPVPLSERGGIRRVPLHGAHALGGQRGHVRSGAQGIRARQNVRVLRQNGV